MKKPLIAIALLSAASMSQAASFIADISFMGATMTGAYVKVISVSGGATGWGCNLSVWPSSTTFIDATTTTLAQAVPSTKDFTTTANYTADNDSPINLCIEAAKIMPMFSNVR